MLIRFIAYPVTAYLTGGALFYFKQERLIFPAPAVFDKITPADNGLLFEDLRIPVNTKDDLHAWWIPAVMPSKQVVLIFHGNGYVLADMVQDEIASLRRIRANLMLIDYRGYGSSSPINPDETTVDEDANAALNYLLQKRGTHIGKVFLFGRSIGTGPATYLARANQGVAGLILESPFSSIEDIAAARWYLRIYPVRSMLHTHFNNLSAINSVRVPLLIISGTADILTPTRMANSIFAQAHGPKQIYLVPNATHDNVLTEGGEALMRVIRNFVQTER